MHLDWTALRPLNGSQAAGFEELCAQLARAETPAGGKFERKGAPDGGVECFSVLSDGSEWGWQAKYFTTLGDSQFDQLDRSVKKALSKHPSLARYFVCVPLDRPDARVAGKNPRWSAGRTVSPNGKARRGSRAEGSTSYGGAAPSCSSGSRARSKSAAFSSGSANGASTNRGSMPASARRLIPRARATRPLSTSTFRSPTTWSASAARLQASRRSRRKPYPSGRRSRCWTLLYGTGTIRAATCPRRISYMP